MVALALLASAGVAAAHEPLASRPPAMATDPRSWRGFHVDLRGVVEGIEAQRGVIVRTAPDDPSTVLVDFGGDGALRFAVTGAGARRLLEDRDVVIPPASGTPSRAAVVRLPARTADDVLAGVVNTRGVVEARSLVIHDGVARLLGGETVTVAK